MTPAQYPAWLDGVRSEAITVQSRALRYGDGVFRTMLRHAGHIAARAEQLARLCADAAVLGLRCNESMLAGVLRNAEADGMPDACVVRLNVLRGGAGRGYLPDDAVPVQSLLTTAALPEWNPALWQEGIRSDILVTPVGRQAPALAGIKHFNRLEQVMAAREVAARQLDEGICCDVDGKVVSGSRSNVFWRIGEVLFTPALQHSGVRGVTRDRIIRLAPLLGLKVSECEVPAGELDACEELFFCNSLFGVWPVRQLGQRNVSVGAVAPELLRALPHPFPATADLPRGN